MKGSAEFSPCKLFRYKLTREWAEPNEKRRNILFVMLNPSTADENVFDPTVRRCFGFAQRWGFNSMAVGNIYAYRATDPKDMLKARDEGTFIVGKDNDSALFELASEADKIICAWGAMKWAKVRSQKVINFLTRWYPDKLYCLKKSKDGSPCHPLYLRNDLEPIKIEEIKI